MVVEDQAGALRVVELLGQREGEEVGRHRDLGERAEHAGAPPRGRPRRGPSPPGALRTVPATSLPGTNGSGGLIWYSPRVWSTSGNDTPAACTSISTPLPGVSMWEGSGSGTSASARADPAR